MTAFSAPAETGAMARPPLRELVTRYGVWLALGVALVIAGVAVHREPSVVGAASQ